jgi:hypothetical protein
MLSLHMIEHEPLRHILWKERGLVIYVLHSK